MKRRRMSPSLLNWASGQRTARTNPQDTREDRVYADLQVHEPGTASKRNIKIHINIRACARKCGLGKGLSFRQ